MDGLNNLALAGEYIKLFTSSAAKPKSTNNTITPPDQQNMVRPLPETTDKTNVMVGHHPPNPVTEKKRKRDRIANKKRKNRMKDAFLSSDKDSEDETYGSGGGIIQMGGEIFRKRTRRSSKLQRMRRRRITMKKR